MIKRPESYNQQTMARAVGVSLNVSMKSSAEVLRAIRGKKVKYAISFLEDVKEMKRAVPYTRFNRGGVGHKKNIGPGRYPVKTSEQILRLLKEVEANAKNKGLNATELIIRHAVANLAAKTPRYGRKRGRTAKRTHLEIIVEEAKGAKKEATPAKKAKKTTAAKKKTAAQPKTQSTEAKQ